MIDCCPNARSLPSRGGGTVQWGGSTQRAAPPHPTAPRTSKAAVALVHQPMARASSLPTAEYKSTWPLPRPNTKAVRCKSTGHGLVYQGHHGFGWARSHGVAAHWVACDPWPWTVGNDKARAMGSCPKTTRALAGRGAPRPAAPPPSRHGVAGAPPPAEAHCAAALLALRRRGRPAVMARLALAALSVLKLTDSKMLLSLQFASAFPRFRASASPASALPRCDGASRACGPAPPAPR